MQPTIDFYFSFRSPYSYIAAQVMLSIPEKYNVNVHVRPVLPLAVRQPEFFNPEHAKRVRYILMDWERRAEMLKLPHKFPVPDPIVQDLTTLKISEHQPHIYRLCYLGVEAVRQGKGLAFIAEVSKFIWGGTENWDQDEHFKQAVLNAGLDLEQLEKAILEPTWHKEEIDKNQLSLDASGHWGVPTFVFNKEPYFGQDRIDSLCWSLEKQGLLK